MRNLSTRGVILCTTLALSGSLLAHTRVEQKTQIHFGGALGGVINTFGGKATREGTTSTVVVRGDRKSTTTESSREIIDLAQEKIYRLDLERKTYKVQTFAELRKQMEDAQRRASRESNKPAKNEGPEYQVDVDIKDTGAKKAINGFNTKETLVTITVHEKGKAIEESGGAVMKADMWMGPRLAAMKEMEDFDRRYFMKLYSGTNLGIDMQQAAMLMAQNPSFGEAMKKFQEKRNSFDGTAIQSNVRFEVVGGANQESAESENNAAPSDAAVRAIGGLLGKMKKRNSSGDTSTAAAREEDRAALFTSTVEVLKADNGGTEEDLSIPADFKQVR
jgi:hypothetical protein